MKKMSPKFRLVPAFSLAEMLAALVIGAMVLVAALAIYNRNERISAVIISSLNAQALPTEVLQKIAEDLDNIIAADKYTKIKIDNGIDHLFTTAKITITKTIYNNQNKEQLFEEISWLSSYDYDSDANGLVLYRSYEGLGVEDKLLDRSRLPEEKNYPLIPLCQGVTFFKIQAYKGKKLLDEWDYKNLPTGIKITISFAEPFKATDATFDVLEEEKITRTIAIDRTRKIKFLIMSRTTETNAKKGP